jgi:hypothetical protein
MANFDDGVSGYIKTKATVEVFFPIDWRGSVEISCKHCPYFLRPQRCGLNQEVVNFPERFVGMNCPLEKVESEDENG